uniref:Proteoglycan 4-like n=1 Tax=Labrus bergylta TaxID=56723 RepID=A0A3Q3EX47_9LABR|nr:proteoglycan 4-like [Labrus bergylta]
MVIKDNEEEVAEKDGKTQMSGAKEKDKVGQAKVPMTSERERTGENVFDKNRGTETDISKEKDGKGDSKVDQEGWEKSKDRRISIAKNKKETEDGDHHMWRDETEKTGEKFHTEEDRGSDGIKMSEERDEHTNKERTQHGEERRKEMEKRIKVERDNEKPKQTESIGRAEEETIKEGEEEEEEEEEDRETVTGTKKEGEKKPAQSEERDGDGELASSESTEGTDFVSISPTDSIISVAPGQDEAITIMSSLPPAPMASSIPHLIMDVDQGETISADQLPTQSTGVGAGGIPDWQSSVTEASTSRPTTAGTINMVGGLGYEDSQTSTWSTSATIPRAGSGAPGQESSSTKTVVKPLPGQAPKPTITPEVEQKFEKQKNGQRPDEVRLPDEPTKLDQKRQPNYQKPTTQQKSKHGKDPKRIQTKKTDQKHPSDILPTDRNIPKQDQENTTFQNFPKPKSHHKSMPPVKRPTSNQRPQSVNVTGSHKDPVTGGRPPYVAVPKTQNSKPDKKLVRPIQTDESDQKPHKQKERGEKTKPDQKSTLNQDFINEPERSETPKLDEKALTESMESSVEDPSLETIQDKSTGQTADQGQIKLSDQKSKPGPKIPKINQKPKPATSKPNQKHPKLATGQKSKPNVKPKQDQTQNHRRLKTSQPDRTPDLNTKSEEEFKDTSLSKPPPQHRTPSNPTFKAGETPVKRPKPTFQLKPSPKTRTSLNPPASDGIQNSQTNAPPASDGIKEMIDLIRSPEDTDLKHKKQDENTMKAAVTPRPKTSSSPATGPFPQLHTHSQGFTTAPSSRIPSDLRPQTASLPPSIAMTTEPNKIMRVIFQGVVPSTGPVFTQPNQAKSTPGPTPDPDKVVVPVPSAVAQTTSRTSPEPRSTTTPASSELLHSESSTPSARELRVKINQVAAFLNNSLSPNKRPPDRRPKQIPEDRTDSKQPTLTASKVTLMKRDCSDLMLRGKTKSGVYLVTPDLRSRSFSVSCDMDLEGGGWTILQRRKDGSVSFNRTWAEYRSGFGDLNGEFWLGNNMIHLLTRDRDMVLRVELEDFNGVMEFARYEHFRVESERMRYRLSVGGYSGTAGDALSFSKTYDHNNRAFTTPDRDHDRYPSGNCGAYYSSGWWFDACMAANLNGRYYVGRYKGVRDGIFWGTWHNISAEYYPTNDRQSFKAVRMMIRPKGFAS